MAALPAERPEAASAAPPKMTAAAPERMEGPAAGHTTAPEEVSHTSTLRLEPAPDAAVSGPAAGGPASRADATGMGGRSGAMTARDNENAEKMPSRPVDDGAGQATGQCIVASVPCCPGCGETPAAVFAGDLPGDLARTCPAGDDAQQVVSGQDRSEGGAPAEDGPIRDAAARIPTWVAGIEGTTLNVRDTLIRVAAHLGSVGVDPEAAGDLEVALAELLNNIVEHGYPPDQTGAIRLEIDVLPEAIVCRVIDRGIALPGGQLPPARGREPAGLPRQQLPEGGYGWDMIHALTDLIRYRRCGDCNCLAFVLRTEPTDFA